MLFSAPFSPTGAAGIKTKARRCLKRKTGWVNCGEVIDSKEFSIEKLFC